MAKAQSIKDLVAIDFCTAMDLTESLMVTGDIARPWFVKHWGLSPKYEGSIEVYNEGTSDNALIAVDIETGDSFCMFFDEGVFLVYNGNFANCEYLPDDLPNKIAKFERHVEEADARAAWIARINNSIKA